MLPLLAKPNIPKSFQSGRYQVLDLIGHGASGSVFKVKDQELDGEIVALKVLHPHLITEEKTLTRFREQVLLARQLSHPNILQIFDFHRDQAEFFITMEYVEGRSLKDFLLTSAGAVSFAELLNLLLDVAKGLAYAHSRGIVHRDLKPSNLLISYSGALKLADFGLAKSLESTYGLTQTGEIIGTPSYMAPEQFRGEMVDARADVYSFGILAFELSEGRLPYPEKGYVAQASAHLTQALPDFSNRNSESAPEWFQQLVKRCCEKDPGCRFPSARELEAVLSNHVQSGASSVTPTLRYTFLKDAPLRRQYRRAWRYLFFAGLVMLGATIAAATQSNSRIAVGTLLLRAEAALGIDLWPLKVPFTITVSLARPQEIRSLMSEEASANTNIAAWLAAGGAKNVVDEEGNGLPHWALQNPDLNVFNHLFEAGVDLNLRNKRGETALVKALRDHRTWQGVRLCLYHANPNLCDYSGVCPIHLAVEQRDYELIIGLMRSGANVSVPNAAGRTVVHEAAEQHDLESLALLLDPWLGGAANSDFRDRDGVTPLMAVAAGVGGDDLSDRSAEILIRRGANVRSRDDEGRTALLHALLHRRASLVRFLLGHGANPLDRDSAGKSAREYAVESGLAALTPIWTEP